MGSPSDEPYRGRYDETLHEVTLTHDILYDQYETTQEEWTAAGFPNLAGTKANSAGGIDCTDPSCPAAMMTWLEAANYANWRSRKEGFEECVELVDCHGKIGEDFLCTDVRQTTTSYYDCKGYRFPTMAEFQYAARAGTNTAFYSGPFDILTDQCVDIDHLSEIAWYCANSDNRTHPVGQKKPNNFGLFDMLGNAMEFMGSQTDTGFVGPEPQTDPHPSFTKDRRFGLAGSCYFSLPFAMRVASQAQFVLPTRPGRVDSGPGGGFRLVRSISPEEAAKW